MIYLYEQLQLGVGQGEERNGGRRVGLSSILVFSSVFVVEIRKINYFLGSTTLEFHFAIDFEEKPMSRWGSKIRVVINMIGV